MDSDDGGPPRKMSKVQIIGGQDNSSMVVNLQRQQRQRQRQQQRQQQDQQQQQQQHEGPCLIQVIDSSYAESEHMQLQNLMQASESLPNLSPIQLHREKQAWKKSNFVEQKHYKPLLHEYAITLASRKLVMQYRQRIVNVQREIISNEVDKMTTLREGLKLKMQPNTSQSFKLKPGSYKMIYMLQQQVKNRIQRVAVLEHEEEFDASYFHNFLEEIREEGYNVEEFAEILTDSDDDSLDERSECISPVGCNCQSEIPNASKENNGCKSAHIRNHLRPELMYEEYLISKVYNNNSQSDRLILENNNLRLQNKCMQEPSDDQSKSQDKQLEQSEATLRAKIDLTERQQLKIEELQNYCTRQENLEVERRFQVEVTRLLIEEQLLNYRLEQYRLEVERPTGDNRTFEHPYTSLLTQREYCERTQHQKLRIMQLRSEAELRIHRSRAEQQRLEIERQAQWDRTERQRLEGTRIQRYRIRPPENSEDIEVEEIYSEKEEQLEANLEKETKRARKLEKQAKQVEERVRELQLRIEIEQGLREHQLRNLLSSISGYDRLLEDPKGFMDINQKYQESFRERLEKELKPLHLDDLIRQLNEAMERLRQTNDGTKPRLVQRDCLEQQCIKENQKMQIFHTEYIRIKVEDLQRYCSEQEHLDAERRAQKEQSRLEVEEFLQCCRVKQYQLEVELLMQRAQMSFPMKRLLEVDRQLEVEYYRRTRHQSMRIKQLRMEIELRIQGHSVEQQQLEIDLEIQSNRKRRHNYCIEQAHLEAEQIAENYHANHQLLEAERLAQTIRSKQLELQARQQMQRICQLQLRIEVELGIREHQQLQRLNKLISDYNGSSREREKLINFRKRCQRRYKEVLEQAVKPTQIDRLVKQLNEAMEQAGPSNYAKKTLSEQEPLHQLQQIISEQSRLMNDKNQNPN